MNWTFAESDPRALGITSASVLLLAPVEGTDLERVLDEWVASSAGGRW